MALLLLIIFFFVLYALLIFYYYRGWKMLREEQPAPAFRPVMTSVVIAARNEADRIGKLMEALQVQTYPKASFEVLVVNDFSTDETEKRALVSGLSNLRVIIPGSTPEHSSKKKAIESGIRAARGELIVTTDADCIPPPEWLQNLAGLYVGKNAAFIAAPVRFTSDGSFLQNFQCLDFMTLQGITAASVSTGFHSMCNGANLAYPKKIFEEVNGFAGIDRVATGDDMLLMYKIWKRQPSKVFYLKNKAAIVTTAPMPTWRDFLMQRRRWASKSLVYDDYRIMAVLGFVYIFNSIFLLLLVLALFDAVYLWWALAFVFIKSAIEYPFVLRVSQFFGEEKRMRWFFIFQPLHILYTILAGFLGQLGKYEWKGRRTK